MRELFTTSLRLGVVGPIPPGPTSSRVGMPIRLSSVRRAGALEGRRPPPRDAVAVVGTPFAAGGR